MAGTLRCPAVDALSSAALAWRPLTAADLYMLAKWLREPQVARWWNHETTSEAIERDFGPSVRGEEPGEDLVVSLDGHPIGLVQRSVISDYPEDLAEFAAIVDVPDCAIELDYLIGAAAQCGRGLGARMIAAAVENTWTDYPSAPAVLVAIVAANIASWRRWRRRACGGLPKARCRLTTLRTTRCTTSTASTGPATNGAAPAHTEAAHVPLDDRWTEQRCLRVR
jgi:aminoglycoside 6'-N-acetyltransferase